MFVKRKTATTGKGGEKQMRITLKRISMVVLTVILLVSSVYPCFATTQDGKITVMLVDREKNHINGVQVNICQIAELNHTGYFPTKAFENSNNLATHSHQDF